LEERRQSVTEHLAELRSALVRSLVYVAVGAVFCWFAYGPIEHLLFTPVRQVLDRFGAELAYYNLADAFMVKCQIALAGGAALAMPAVLIEVWLFLRPALDRSGRRVFYIVGPMVFVLFWAGVLTAYWLVPKAVRWFAGYSQAQGIPLRQNTKQLVSFVAKMCLAFGGAFQLPVVMMALGKTGLVTSRGLLKWWRHAVVVLAALAAVITPSNDAPTMLMMTVPLLVLYALSIVLVRLVEPRKAGEPS
jgi:sec-independent protein translocase protein TatC